MSQAGCLTRDEILSLLENGVTPEAEKHFRGCSTCRDFHAALRKDLEALEISMSLVWKEERISCPHRDVLRAFADGALAKAARDYVEFHLREIACEFCLANVDDLQTIESSDQGRYLKSVHERVLNSTTAFLEKQAKPKKR